MIDAVESLRISQIKLEFTGGAGEVLKYTKSLPLSDQVYELLTADVD